MAELTANTAPMATRWSGQPLKKRDCSRSALRADPEGASETLRYVLSGYLSLAHTRRERKMRRRASLGVPPKEIPMPIPTERERRAQRWLSGVETGLGIALAVTPVTLWVAWTPSVFFAVVEVAAISAFRPYCSNETCAVRRGRTSTPCDSCRNRSYRTGRPKTLIRSSCLHMITAASGPHAFGTRCKGSDSCCRDHDDVGVS